MPKTLTFAVESTVSASNGAVWEVLGDFGTEHRWTKCLDRCTRDTDVVRVGTIRTCTLPTPLMGRTAVREQLTEYEPGTALAYRLKGPAGPFASASSRWSPTSRSDGGTIVTVEGFFTARSRAAEIVVWPLARPMLRRLTRRVIGELEAFVLGQSEPIRPGSATSGV
jgi:uncharacterized protein YndB with AHSA1/START domain